MQIVNLKRPMTLLADKHSLFHSVKYLIDNGKKLLFILLLLLSCNLMSYSQQFTVYDEWDFESATLGSYDSMAIAQDFEIVTSFDHDCGTIAIDTIDGVPTKVLKVTHPKEATLKGFDLDARLSQDFDEVYLSFNFKFGKNFNATHGGKIPGLGGLPVISPNVCPEPDQGFLCKGLHVEGMRMKSYHYDRSSKWCPWTLDDYYYDSIYFNNGCWYNITRRVVLNTFTNGVANADGVNEVWVDGRLIFQETTLKFMEVEHDTMKIDDLNIASFYGGTGFDCEPKDTVYTYIDNIKIYMPADDSIIGNNELHHPSTILPTPDEITDRTVYYDSLVTLQGTLSNTEYGTGYYSSCVDEAFLIDAGEGNSVDFEITDGYLGGGDYLCIYDGNTTDAAFLAAEDAGSISLTKGSTGRYMFVRFSTNKSTSGTPGGWTGTVTFHSPGPPDPPTSLEVTDSSNYSISIQWDDGSNNEDKFIIERSTGAGFGVYDSVNANVTTFTDPGLSVETTYWYRVKAKNENGESTYAGPVFATPDTISPPVNVALNKPAGASSIENSGFAAEYAFDGNKTTTRWASAETDNESICVDLEGSFSLTKVILYWEDAYGLAYSIDVSSDSSNWTPVFSTSSGDGGKDSINLSNEPARYVRMNGTDRGTPYGYSLYEFEVYGTPNNDTIPEAPSNLHATDSTATTISIAWTDNADNEDKFIIERSLTSGSGFAVIDSVNANVATYTNTGLTTETTYYYKVKARNSYGDSEYSNTESCTTPGIPSDTTNVALNKPASASSIENSGFAAEYAFDGDKTTSRWASAETDYESICVDLEGSYDLTKVILYWEAAYGLAYSIDVSSDSSNWAPVFSTSSGDGGKDSINISDESGRYVRMNGTDRGTAWGYSLYEFEVYGVPSDDLPVAPSNLHATDSTATTISIAWTDNADNEDKFIIERSLTSGSGFAVIDSVNANVTTYTNTGLTAETTYYYKVKAKNGVGESSYSNTLEANTVTVTISNVSQGKTAIQSSTTEGGVASRAVDGNTNGYWTNYSVTHTDDETNAWWQVDLGDDYQVTSIEVWNRTDYCCMDRLDNYYVMLADTFTSTSLSTALSESTWSEHKTTYPDPTHYFYPDTTGHYVRVQLGDTNNLSLAEVIVWGYDADLKKAILSEEIKPGLKPEKPINVYPNPGSNMITISGFDHAIEIKMVDMLGKVVYMEGKVNNSTQIDVSNLKKGLYLIMLKTESNYHLKKFIKN